MRTRNILTLLKQIHNKELSLQTRFSSSRVLDSARGRWVANAATCSAKPGNHVTVVSQIGSVRLMGIGSHKEGNRAGQHGVHYPHAKADGSPEKQEADAREQFLEKAKAESASNLDEAQETSTTELHFGVKDGKNTNEAISHASEELFKRSTINAQSSEPAAIKEKDKRKYYTEVSSASKDGGTQAFRDNIEKKRSEMKAGKARSPQAGVRVGNVPSAGANAIDNEEDIPQFSKEQQETGDETLDKAQKGYEQAISGFGTQGDKNLQDKA